MPLQRVAQGKGGHADQLMSSKQGAAIAKAPLLALRRSSRTPGQHEQVAVANLQVLHMHVPSVQLVQAPLTQQVDAENAPPQMWTRDEAKRGSLQGLGAMVCCSCCRRTTPA